MRYFGILLLLGLSLQSFADVFHHPVEDEVFYFLLTDRFEDGDPANNSGGLLTDSGYDPRRNNHFHGGDIRGLIQRLDYLDELGITAIWLSPVQVNMSTQFNSAGYHGYWILDFLNVDPHLGTNEEFREFVDAAHEKNMKVFMDIVVNHTADVCFHQEGIYSYRSKMSYPYRDALGNTFDDRDYASLGLEEDIFPEMALSSSFPYTPIVSAGNEDIRNPAFLNDLTNYHHRGNSEYYGENSLYGDFSGLDDVFTEKPEVVKGFIDVFAHWVKVYDVDGFRIDTAKHVNMEFWQAFGVAMKKAAEERDLEAQLAAEQEAENIEQSGDSDASGGGTEDGSGSGDPTDPNETPNDGDESEEDIVADRYFFLFGEVFDGDARFNSEFSTLGSLDATLDFGMAYHLRDWISRRQGPSQLIQLFSQDDYFTDLDSHVRARPTFLGNHDMGRWAHMLESDNPFMGEEQLIDLVDMGYACLFFMRGQPVIYYGDEQGFVGYGEYDAARQDMLPGQTAVYNNDDLLGTDATTASSNFDNQHPIFQKLKKLISIYKSHDALRRGTQVVHDLNSVDVFGVSRFMFDEKTEYLFVANTNRAVSREAIIPTVLGEGRSFEIVFDSSVTATVDGLEEERLFVTDEFGQLSVSIPPLKYLLLRSVDLIPFNTEPVLIEFPVVESGDTLYRVPYTHEGHVFEGRIALDASIDVTEPAYVSFYYKWQTEDIENEAENVGSSNQEETPEEPAWVPLGVDDNAPYRVYFSPEGRELGALFDVKAVVTTISGLTDEAIVESLIVGN